MEQPNGDAVKRVSVRVVGGGHVDVRRHAARATTVSGPGGSRIDTHGNVTVITVYCNVGQHASVTIPDDTELDGVASSVDMPAINNNPVLILIALALLSVLLMLIVICL